MLLRDDNISKNIQAEEVFMAMVKENLNYRAYDDAAFARRYQDFQTNRGANSK